MATPDPVTAVVAALVAAGVPATADRRNLNPPAVFVEQPTVLHNTLAGYTATLNLVCVAGNIGTPDATTALDGLARATRAVWPGPRDEPYSLPGVDGGDPLPARRLPVRVRVTPDVTP
jgi:hypothetical protein